MALNVGTLYQELELDDRKWKSGLSKVAGETRVAGNKAGDGFSDGMNRGMKDVERHAKRMSNSMKMAIGAGVAAIGAGIFMVGRQGLDLAKQSITAASAWQQNVGGLEAIYGKNAAAMAAWSKEQYKFGLNQNAAAEMAMRFGSAFKNAGFSMGEVKKQTKDLISLGQDMAAMYGGTAEEASSALLGAVQRKEFNPAERYGLSLSADLVKAEAVTAGIATSTVDPVLVKQRQAAVIRSKERYNELLKDEKATTGEIQVAKAQMLKTEKDLETAMAGKVDALTTQQTQLATLSLINRQSQDTKGQATREMGTYAAQLEKFKAQVENLKISAGKKLLPIATDVLEDLNKNMPKVKKGLKNMIADLPKIWGDLKKWWKENGDTIKESLETMMTALKAFGGATKKAVDAFAGLPDGMRDVLAFAALGTIAFGRFVVPLAKAGKWLFGLPAAFSGASTAAAGSGAAAAAGWSGVAAVLGRIGAMVGRGGLLAVGFASIAGLADSITGKVNQWATDMGIDQSGLVGAWDLAGMSAGNILDKLNPFGDPFTQGYKDNSAAKRKVEAYNESTRQIWDMQSNKFKKRHYLYTDASTGAISINKKPKGTAAAGGGNNITVQSMIVQASNPDQLARGLQRNTRRNARRGGN